MSQQVPSPSPSPPSPFPKPPGITLGIGLTTPSPELAQICGNSGFDFVMIDMEHGPTTFETAYRMVTALAGTPASAWIRVPTNDAVLVKRALDTGATDIVVPMVTTREEAEQAVNMGYLDGPGHPDVQAALALAASKIAAHGFPLMRFAVTPEQARQAIADGVTMLMLGFDTMFVPAAVQLYLGQLQRALESANG